MSRADESRTSEQQRPSFVADDAVIESVPSTPEMERQVQEWNNLSNSNDLHTNAAREDDSKLKLHMQWRIVMTIATTYFTYPDGVLRQDMNDPSDPRVYAAVKALEKFYNKRREKELKKISFAIARQKLIALVESGQRLANKTSQKYSVSKRLRAADAPKTKALPETTYDKLELQVKTAKYRLAVVIGVAIAICIWLARL